MKFPSLPANLADFLQVASAEKSRRLHSQAQLKTIQVSAEEQTYVTLPGTCTIFAGIDKQPQFEALHRAFVNRDENLLQSVAVDIQDTAIPTEKDSLSTEDLINATTNATALVDISYRHKPLLANLPLSKSNSLAILPLPYNGGNLIPEKFRMETFSEDQRENVTAFVVLHKPKTTDVERALIDMIPEDVTELHLASFGPLAIAPTLLAATLAATAMHTPFLTAGISPTPDALAKLQSVSLSDDEIRELGDWASADTLLERRRQALWE